MLTPGSLNRADDDKCQHRKNSETDHHVTNSVIASVLAFEWMITRYKVGCSHIVSASDAKIVLLIA